MVTVRGGVRFLYEGRQLFLECVLFLVHDVNSKGSYVGYRRKTFTFGFLVVNK